MAKCFLKPCTIIQVTLYLGSLGSLAKGKEDIKTLCNAANKIQVKTQQLFASRKIWVIMNPVVERQKIGAPSKTCNHMSEFPLITVTNMKGLLSC